MKRLAWGMYALSVLLTAATVYMWADAHEPLRRLADNSYFESVLISLTFGLVGALIVAKQPRHPVGWLFCGSGLGVAVGSAFFAWSVFAARTHPSLPGEDFAAWVQSMTFVPSLSAMIFLLLVFPDGKLPAPRWRWVVRVALVGIGLLELTLPRVPSPRQVTDIGSAAHALAYVLVAARRHTDVFEWGMRSTPFSLAAEIQRRLLPAAYTCEAGQFTLAGWLEPAASVGGDTFDYVLDRDHLQVSITDAVGHQVAASLLATLLVGGLRNGRRKGLGLSEQAGYANDCLIDNAVPGQFVTGQLLRVDLDSGAAGIVNAGHPLPLRLRSGVVQEIELRAQVPFGVLPGKTFDVQPFHLEPGDRFVFLTDGMLERNAASLDVATALAGGTVNTNVDTIPLGVWDVVKAERIRIGLTERQFQAAIGTHYCGSTLYESCPSRERLMRCAEGQKKPRDASSGVPGPERSTVDGRLSTSFVTRSSPDPIGAQTRSLLRTPSESQIAAQTHNPNNAG